MADLPKDIQAIGLKSETSIVLVDFYHVLNRSRLEEDYIRLL